MTEPIRDLETAVREYGALPMPARSRPTLRGVAETVIAAAMRQGHTAPAMLAEALESAQLLQAPETAAELERLRARLTDVHRIPQDNLTPAEVRLAQYGERTKAWSTATYDSGTEKALHEIACALQSTLEETRDQRNAARLRVIELEEQRDRRRARLVALQNDALNMRGSLAPNGEDRKVPFPLGETLAPAVDWLINRVAELETERHTTNEALSDAAEQLRVDRDRIARLEKAAVEGRAALASFCHDLEDPGTAALGALYLLQQATVGTPMQPGETTPKVHRASHDSIEMGLYTTAAEARAHCEAEERRSWPTGTDLTFDWIEDEEDGVAELTVVAGQNEESVTGYAVTALDVASAYDEEADE
ncbi:hypothetical protein [Streptomyces sp.]|uniref:hypothetical protein n=1 Tax=Streptomyces sp. TaxID=1931 RepID=UPI002D3D49C8|nr:hypothetical protein [Streptomyces sp.]HZF92021.1 hypothetical protein [Streptomyces sp.]